MNAEISTTGARAGNKVRALTIEVTEEIIATSIPEHSGHCMIADAVKSAAKAKKMRIGKVEVDLQTIRFTDLDEGRKYVCWTPRVGQLSLLQFDKGQKPEPFAFKLKPVQIIDRQHRERKATAGQPGKGPGRPSIAFSNKQGHRPPLMVGGKALPEVAIGKRREFGLGGMGVWSPAEAPTETVSESTETMPF